MTTSAEGIIDEGVMPFVDGFSDMVGGSAGIFATKPLNGKQSCGESCPCDELGDVPVELLF